MNELQNRTSVPRPISSQVDYILLDGSGSMIDKWWPMLGAIDAYVETVKSNNVRSQITLQTFCSIDIDCVQRSVDLDAWVPLSQQPVGAHWGGTPLYDAINVLGRRMKELDPPRASIVIVTDGHENESKTTIVQARAILDWMRAKGWQVTFIGCNWDNEGQAKMLGANRAAAIGVEKSHLADAARSLGEKRAEYGLYGTPMHFNEGERQQFGGYLAKPKDAE